MKKAIIVIAVLFCTIFSVQAQKYLTKEGVIDIYSETSLFVIEAKNQKVASILNTDNGEIVVSTLVRSFKFKEALVEEHFNENYMESHLYPKAQFKGKIMNFSQINTSKDGSYTIQIEGDLTLHGETRPLKTSGKLTVKSGSIIASTEFLISLENYKVKIEEQYKDRISDEIKLTVHFDLKPM
jgi:hypothetical protein